MCIGYSVPQSIIHTPLCPIARSDKWCCEAGRRACILRCVVSLVEITFLHPFATAYNWWVLDTPSSNVKSVNSFPDSGIQTYLRSHSNRLVSSSNNGSRRHHIQKATVFSSSPHLPISQVPGQRDPAKKSQAPKSQTQQPARHPLLSLSLSTPVTIYV